MTNIKTGNMWPKVLDSVHDFGPSKESLTQLFDLRKKTYVGFATIEKEKGLLEPTMSFSSTKGQEAVRILVQRGLEELAEAWESNNRDHYLEELIDAINYFWVLAIMDEQAPLESILESMARRLKDHKLPVIRGNPRLSTSDLGLTVIYLNPIFEKLRHRAWMQTCQSQYFDGWIEIAHFLGDNLCLILDQFEDWHEFVRYFIAKDNVLQFRLETNY